MKILVIEDDNDHAALIARVLAKGVPGCDVHWAASGADAKALLESWRGKALPGLITLDMSLGDMTGLEMLEWLSDRRRFAVVPVIMFTSSLAANLAERALALGARRFVGKSLNFRDLIKDVLEVVPIESAMGAHKRGK